MAILDKMTIQVNIDVRRLKKATKAIERATKAIEKATSAIVEFVVSTRQLELKEAVRQNQTGDDL